VKGMVESNSDKLQPVDPFYADRSPCMMICLPTYTQGRQAGVSFVLGIADARSSSCPA
jgi:hypothetical protein